MSLSTVPTPLASQGPSASPVLSPIAPSGPTVQEPSTTPPNFVTVAPVQPADKIPTVSPEPTTMQPSTSPTVTPLPTKTPSPTTTASDSPTQRPVVEQGAVILTCSQPDEVLARAQPPFDAVTAIPFKVGYLVESSDALPEYVDLLNIQIIEAFAAGALQCNTGGPLFGSVGSGTGIDTLSLPIITLETGASCQPEISECTVLESSGELLVAQDVDPEVAAFLGYVLLREEMDGGQFVRDNTLLDRVEYLSPLPLLPPLGEDGLDGPLDPNNGLSAAGTINVSPWTLGAVVTMCKSSMCSLHRSAADSTLALL